MLLLISWSVFLCQLTFCSDCKNLTVKAKAIIVINKIADTLLARANAKLTPMRLLITSAP